MPDLLHRLAEQYQGGHHQDEQYQNRPFPDDPDPDDPEKLFETRSGATVLISGTVVVKLHRAGTDGGRLAARLRLAAAPGACLLLPLTPQPVPADDGRWVTVWPRVDPVPPEPETAPWAAAGDMLAHLHSANPPIGSEPPTGTEPPAGIEPLAVEGPEHGAVARLNRSLRHLAGVPTPAAGVVRAAAGHLPAAALRTGLPTRPRTLVHGDWHLGQLGRERRPGASWVMFDLDDLGLGDPAWDLARPAGFWAAGLLPDDDWRAFLDGYRTAGGPAVPAGDPWPALDAVARAAVVQAAAAGLSRAANQGGQPDDVDLALVEACARMR